MVGIEDSIWIGDLAFCSQKLKEQSPTRFCSNSLGLAAQAPAVRDGPPYLRSLARRVTFDPITELSESLAVPESIDVLLQLGTGGSHPVSE